MSRLWPSNSVPAPEMELIAGGTAAGGVDVPNDEPGSG